MDNRNSKGISEQYERITAMLVRIKKGDKDAFQELYDSTWKTIFYLLMKKLGDEADALTVLNDTFGEAYLNIHKLENDQLFMKWLMRIAQIKSMRFLKAKYRQSKEEPQGDAVGEDIEEIDDDFIPEKALVNKETRDLLLKVVDELPQAQREAIFMFYYQNLTVEEIAHVTACPQNTVYKRLHDAKKSLKVKLSNLISKGITLYGTGNFYVLREVFKADIEDHAAKVSHLATWTAVAGHLGIAAPGATQAAAQGVSTAAASLSQAAGTAIANAALIKTVILGVVATTAIATATVVVQKSASTPVEIEQPPALVSEHTDALLSTPEDYYDTVHPGEGSDIAVIERDKAVPTPTEQERVSGNRPETNRGVINGDESPWIRPPDTVSEVEGRTSTGQASAASSAYETGQTGLTQQEPAQSTPERDEVPEQVPEPETTATPMPEPEPTTATAAANLSEQIPREASSPPRETPTSGERPAPTVKPETEPQNNSVITTPKATTPPAPRATESQSSQEGGGSSGNKPSRESKYFEHIYEINSAPIGDAVIDDISVFSGEMFSRVNDTVTVYKNDFRREAIGKYEVNISVVRRNGGVTLDLYSTLYVVDTNPPVIEVGNPYVTLEEGTAATQEQILEKGAVSVSDNSGEVVFLNVTGYGEIDFNAPGQYSLELNAKDSQGNEAFQKAVIVIVVP